MTVTELAYMESVTTASGQEDLVLQELSQVYYIASRLWERLPEHVELDDLVSAGVIGLLEAQRSFDPSKQVQFKTYAKFRIRGAILDSLRESDWGSRSLRRRGREIVDATSRLEAKLGRQPSEMEIANEMQIAPERFRKLVSQIDGSRLKGQQVMVSGDGAEPLDIIESAPNLEEPDAFDLCLTSERNAHLEEAVSKLTEREQLILSLYYREELTMKEIAEVVGVALSRVSQILAATIQKLRISLQHLQNSPSARTAGIGANDVVTR
jgi:RNA polymerase sigma factor FliA